MADNSGTTLYYNTDKGRIGVPADVPSDQIREYFASEGLSPEAIDAAMSKPETAGLMDRIPDSVKGLFPYGKAVAAGAGKAIPHLFDVARLGGNYLNKGIDYLEDKAGIERPSNKSMSSLVTGQQDEFNPSLVTDAAGKAIGGWHEPQSRTESVLEAAGEGAVGGLAGPGGWLSKLMLYGALPGAASEAAGQAAHELPGSDYTEAPTRYLTSLFAPGVTRKFLTPNTITNPNKLAAVQRTEAAMGRRDPTSGVPTVTAGQATDNENLMARELRANKNINDIQNGRFMEQATEAAGERTRDVTSGHPGSYIHRGINRARNGIEDMANNTFINPQVTAPGMTQPGVYNDLVNLARSRPQDIGEVLPIMARINRRWTPGASAMPNAEEYHNALFGQGGPTATRAMTGQDYQALRSALHNAAGGTNPQTAHTMRQIADSLDTAMEGTVAQHNPSRLGGWNRARRQYANMLTLEDLAGGAKAGQTRFSPDEWKSSSQRVMDRRPYLRGELENTPLIEDYAKAAPQLKKGEGKVGGDLLALAGLATGPLLNHFGIPAGEAYTAAIAAGMGGPHLANLGTVQKAIRPIADSVTLHPAYQGYQRNQAFPLLPQQRGQRINSQILRALMENQRQQQ